MAKSKKRVQRINWAQMLLTEKSPWVIQEAYRELRTNIMFSLPGDGCKVIGVTSPDRSAGKSLNSINLASSLHEAGKRVLLMDCDLRLPTVHSKMGLKQEPGFTNYLADSSMSINSVIGSVVSLGGLHVITAGLLMADPTRLLMSEKVRETLVELKAYYDYIVIDLPPVNMVTDALLLADMIDGYLLVIRHEVTQRKSIEEALNKFSFAKNAEILGFVYNDVSIQAKAKGAYTYGQYK